VPCLIRDLSQVWGLCEASIAILGGPAGVVWLGVFDYTTGVGVVYRDVVDGHNCRREESVGLSKDGRKRTLCVR
jgi:hypothetical protein